MSQHDMNLANAAGAAFRSDLNDALGALITNSSGASAPATTFAYQWWADTTTGLLKIRNAANSAWISILTISTGTPAGHVIGTDIQAYDAALASLAGLSLAQGDLIYATAADTYARLAKGTASQQLRMNAGATAPEWFTPTAAGITLGTKQAGSGTSENAFTSLPAGIKRISLNFGALSTNGTSVIIVQLGDSGGYKTSGYAGGIETAAARYTFTDGFKIVGAGSASWAMYGRVVFEMIDSATDTWVGTVMAADSGGSAVYTGAGMIALSGDLDRLRVTTQGGSDTIDVASSLNIAYE